MHSIAMRVIRDFFKKPLNLVCSSASQEGAFALVFKSVHYPGEAVGTRYAHTDAFKVLLKRDFSKVMTIVF